MKYFNKTEDEILFGLIEQDNPDMVPKLNTQNCYITTAQVNTGPDAHQYNTIATVRPRHGSGLHGPRQIKYNRVDLQVLFKDMSPVVASGFSESEQFATRDEMPQILGICYGLPINKGDVDPASSANFYVEGHSEHGKGNFTIANNKCFIGSVTVAFRRDKLENITLLVEPPVLDGLPTEAFTGRGLADPQLPAPWAYFAEFDFTEIIGVVDHSRDFSAGDIASLATFTGMPLVHADGAFDPNCPYKSFGHFGKTAESTSRNEVSGLIGKYPWLNTRYSHVKLTLGTRDPISGALIPEDRQPVFAFYYNKFVG